MKMKRPALPLTGGCPCETVRFECTAMPLLVYACHCTECQRWSGSAFSISMPVAAKSFRVTRGEPKHWRRTGASGVESLLVLWRLRRPGLRRARCASGHHRRSRRHARRHVLAAAGRSRLHEERPALAAGFRSGVFRSDAERFLGLGREVAADVGGAIILRESSPRKRRRLQPKASRSKPPWWRDFPDRYALSPHPSAHKRD
jgi:Glutathione-dependent formaldehyde-activating enzyme